VVYFYCHGSDAEGGASITPSSLHLTDGSVSAFDFERWSNGEMLLTNPVVFINACQGGQMTTMFYKSFAVELLVMRRSRCPRRSHDNFPLVSQIPFGVARGSCR